MIKNINVKYLENFAKLLGISMLHGGKAQLARRLNLKHQSVINGWIARGVPENFPVILENAGIKHSVWEKAVKQVDDMIQKETSATSHSASSLPTAHVDSAASPDIPAFPFSPEEFSEMTKEVLESGSIYEWALRCNIIAFRAGLEVKQKTAEFQKEMDRIRNEMSVVKRNTDSLTQDMKDIKSLLRKKRSTETG